MGFLKNLFDKTPKQPSEKVENKAVCPYCNFEFEERPSRKKKCPNCGNFIFVRQGRLLTQEEAEIDDWLKRVEYLGVTKKVFLEEQEILSQRFGMKASVNDTAWGILNKLVVRKRNNSD